MLEGFFKNGIHLKSPGHFFKWSFPRLSHYHPSQRAPLLALPSTSSDPETSPFLNITYADIQALEGDLNFTSNKDENSKYNITEAEFNTLIGLIHVHRYQHQQKQIDKLSKKDNGTPISVLMVRDEEKVPHYIISRPYNPHRLLSEEEQKNMKKPTYAYDAGYDLTVKKPVFIKKYQDNPEKNSESNAKNKRSLKTEYDNMLAFNQRTCVLYGARLGGKTKAEEKIYGVQPLLDGHDFYDCLKQGLITPTEAISLFNDICKELTEIHQNGYLHLDLKAENFMVNRVSGKATLNKVDYATFRKAKDISKVREILGSEDHLNKDWKKKFLQGKADYSVDVDIYALNITCRDVATHIYNSTHSPAVLEIYHQLTDIEKKPINECYNMKQILKFAGVFQDAVNKITAKPQKVKANF